MLWVLCRDQGLAHLPMMQDPRMLVIRWQRSLPNAVPHPNVMSENRRCPGCFVALLCSLDFAPKTPAGHQLSDSPMKSPGGQSAPEVEALAELLAEVVVLAGQPAMFPSRLEEIAERAQEHQSVRRALRDQQ